MDTVGTIGGKDDEYDEILMKLEPEEVEDPWDQDAVEEEEQ